MARKDVTYWLETFCEAGASIDPTESISLLTKDKMPGYKRFSSYDISCVGSSALNSKDSTCLQDISI